MNQAAFYLNADELKMEMNDLYLTVYLMYIQNAFVICIRRSLLDCSRFIFYWKIYLTLVQSFCSVVHFLE